MISAVYSEHTVRVYQAYGADIAIPALTAGRFVAPFSTRRMTWIKTSFNWMMYRSGYATKSRQEFVLGIDITRTGFEWALRHASLSSYLPGFHSSFDDWKRAIETMPVRIQWDPERDWRLQPIAGRKAIQIGLSGDAVDRYVNDWIIRIEDATSTARIFAEAARTGSGPPLPADRSERPYPLDPAIAVAICPPLKRSC